MNCEQHKKEVAGMKNISNTEVVTVRFQKNNLKDQAHRYFDKLWQFKYVTRAEAYQYLSEWLEVPEPKAHMMFLNDKQCKQVIEFSIQKLNDMRRLDLDFGAPINHPYYELINQ